MDDKNPDIDLTYAHPGMSDNARLIQAEEISPSEIADLDIQQVWEIWSTIKGDRFAPPRHEILLDEMPPALVPRMAMIDFVGPPLDFYYRFFGTAMVRASGIEMQGKTYYADSVTGYGFANAALLPKLIERRAPMCHRVTWMSTRGVTWLTTALRMPLSDDGETVTGALTANHYHAEALLTES